MNLYVVFLIAICNMLGYRASKILVTLFALELGAPQVFVGILIALYGLCQVMFALYAGKLSDRLGVRMPMLFGSAGMASGMLLPFLWPGLPALYVSATLIGASHIFYNVAVQNLIGILSSDNSRARNVSNFALISSFSAMVGPLTAGLSVDHFGHAATYLYLAVLPVTSTLIIASFLRRLRRRHAGKSTESEKIPAAGSLLADKPLRRVLITGAIVITGHDLFQFYMPIYGHSIGLSASAIGAIVSCFGAAAFVVRIWLPTLSRRMGEMRLFLYSIIASAVTYLLFPLFSDAILLGVIAFLLGLGVGSCQPLALILLYACAPPQRRGEALGLRLTINNLMHISLPLVFGAFGSAFGAAPVFIANAVLLASGGLMIRKPGAK